MLPTKSNIREIGKHSFIWCGIYTSHMLVKYQYFKYNIEFTNQQIFSNSSFSSTQLHPNSLENTESSNHQHQMLFLPPCPVFVEDSHLIQKPLLEVFLYWYSRWLSFFALNLEHKEERDEREGYEHQDSNYEARDIILISLILHVAYLNYILEWRASASDSDNEVSLLLFGCYEQHSNILHILILQLSALIDFWNICFEGCIALNFYFVVKWALLTTVLVYFIY